MKKQQLSKRVRDAMARKAAIMSSKEFQTWWAARRHIHPLPSDPYRAFMIDRGLLAHPLEKDYWQPRTNRSDLVRVDIPAHAPATKIRALGRKYGKHRFRAGYTPVAARKSPPLTPLQKEVVSLIESMAEKFHTSVPKVYFEKGASSAYYVGDPFIKPFIRLNSLRTDRAQLKASAAHEMGHHVHHVGADVLHDLNILPFNAANRIDRERTAWKIADPFLNDRRPTQRWRMRWALGTYLGTAGIGKRGVDWESARKKTKKRRR